MITRPAARLFALIALACAASQVRAAEPPASAKPIASKDLVFEEIDGVLAVEAEHFGAQTLTDVRAWHVFTPDRKPEVEPDGDPPHLEGASGGAYVEILPDTRRSHGDRLRRGRNFSNAPGKMAVLHYRVHFNTPGRYYVWARIYSTGTEDNGLHVGIDGTWPETGQRMQWTGKRAWVWGSKQRTAKVHTGVAHQLYLDVAKPGEHVIRFSMREDGTEFDKWMMVREKLDGVKGAGPEPRVKAGSMPKAFQAGDGGTSDDRDSRRPSPTGSDDAPRGRDGDGSVSVTGERKRWHGMTLTQAGPFARESDDAPNPFLDYRMTVTFRHESGAPTYAVPGYFAADGDAANTSAEAGTSWRAHLSPDKPGRWSYRVSFVAGENVAVSDARGEPVETCDGKSGSFEVAQTDKTGRDFRARGRLGYVGAHHLRFAGTGEWFLKVGADAPENFLAYRDFDGAFKEDGQKDRFVKSWAPHVKDWRRGDPTWRDGKGKGIIGALNYLASEELNAVSFLTMNINGDDRNVFPYPTYRDRVRMDCSRLDQWEIVLDHAQRQGLYLHFKTQETENELLLDGGDLGPQRKLYYRELIARFAHHLALNWNLGEEINNASTKQKLAWARYIRRIDPYDHHIVIHNGSNHYDLMGTDSPLTGMSLQTNRPNFSRVHDRTLEYIRRSVKAGKPWVVACDEPGDASHALRPDDDAGRSHVHGRKNALWGHLLAGGAGLEFYFGYRHAHSDLTCQDYRSRDAFWDYCRHARGFFVEHVPFWEMTSADELLAGTDGWCLAKPGETYVVYLPEGGMAKLTLPAGSFDVRWFDPRNGGELQVGQVKTLTGPGAISLGRPPRDADADWAAWVRKRK
jgi:hypothetical protein